MSLRQSIKSKSFRKYVAFVLGAFIVTAVLTSYATSFLGSPLPTWEVAIIVFVEGLLFLGWTFLAYSS